MRESLRASHPIAQLLILLFFGVLAMLLLAGITMIPFLLAGYSLDTIAASNSSSKANTDEIFFLKVLQLVQAIGLFMAPYIAYRFLLRENRYKPTELPYVKIISTLIFGFAMMSAFPLINYLAEWNSALVFPVESINAWMQSTEQNTEHLIRLFLDTDTIGGLLFNLVLIAFIPAVGEELLFRGTFQPLMLKTFKGNYHLAIWVTAFWFSFIHLQFLGFFPRLLLGAILGYAAHWPGSLILPMIGHFVNNALAVLVAFFIGLDTLNSEVETLGSSNDQIQLVLLSLLVLSGGLYLIYRDSTFDVTKEIEA